MIRTPCEWFDVQAEIAFLGCLAVDAGNEALGLWLSICHHTAKRGLWGFA